MTAPAELLVVGDEALAAELGPAATIVRAEPHEALEQLSRRGWPAVLLSAPRPDFAGLCRAARRLQRDGKVFGVCPPACEPQLRLLVGEALDDYFIRPLTGRDLAEIGHAAAPASGVDGAAPDSPGAALPAGEISRLVVAARTVGTLEGHLVEEVESLLGRRVFWADADRAPTDKETLLVVDGKVRRALLADRPVEAGAAARAYLSALRQCLPALVTSAEQTELLRRLAITDHLTGAFNRRYFYKLTDWILRRAERRALRATLLLYDIDDFKRYNDTYGHAAGDEILRDAASLMKRVTRTHDVVARIGGDEFAVLFWDSEPPRVPNSRPIDTAFALTNRFVAALRRHEFRSLGPEARGVLTISGGLASFPKDGRTCRELLRRADQALMEAKDSGKNAIHLVGP